MDAGRERRREMEKERQGENKTEKSRVRSMKIMRYK